MWGSQFQWSCDITRNYYLAICWPTQFFESLKVHDLKIDNRNIHYAVALSTVLQLSHFALWPMGKMLFGPHGFFWLQYLMWPLEKICHPSILPIQYPFLITHPPIEPGLHRRICTQPPAYQ